MIDEDDDTVPPVIVADILDRAADWIDRHGWTQAHYLEADGCVCLVGAIDAAVADPRRMGLRCGELVDQCVEAVADFLGLDAVTSVEDWNDAEDRTVDEVTRVLRDAAEQERGK